MFVFADAKEGRQVHSVSRTTLGSSKSSLPSIDETQDESERRRRDSGDYTRRRSLSTGSTTDTDHEVYDTVKKAPPGFSSAVTTPGSTSTAGAGQAPEPRELTPPTVLLFERGPDSNKVTLVSKPTISKSSLNEDIGTSTVEQKTAQKPSQSTQKDTKKTPVLGSKLQSHKKSPPPADGKEPPPGPRPQDAASVPKKGKTTDGKPPTGIKSEASVKKSAEKNTGAAGKSPLPLEMGISRAASLPKELKETPEAEDPPVAPAAEIDVRRSVSLHSDMTRPSADVIVQSGTSSGGTSTPGREKRNEDSNRESVV